MTVNPPKRGPSATVVIAIGSALLLVMAGVIVALAIALTSAQNPVQAERDDEEVEQPETSEIVLDATLADGGSLSEGELEAAQAMITSRLGAMHVIASDLYVEEDQIHVTFEDDIDEDTLDLAAEALDAAFSLDFRPVLNAGMCSEGNDYTDLGPDEEVVFCDQEGYAALLLGPSELSGESLIGASTYEQETEDGWGVNMTFNAEGAVALAALTQSLVGRDGAMDRLAFTLGGVVLESPEVTESIMDGSVSISGSMDEAQAEALAAQLRLASKGLVLSVDSTTLVD
jgi:preprotein translocase subunit SecD